MDLLVLAQTPDDSTIAGKIDCGILNNSSISGSHVRVSRFRSRVLDAFVGSVTCDSPRVRFQINHESIVPNANFPEFASSRTAGTFFRIQRILVPEKYGSRSRPVFR